MRIDEYGVNTKGIDRWVGDIHGCYDQLMSQLNDLNFDFDNDRLMSVGDIIDRGPDSLKCLGLLLEPWFFCIKGNHEQMMIDALLTNWDHPSEKSRANQLWVQNGGDLYTDLAPEYKAYADMLVRKTNGLPNGIQVGDIGMVHAEAPLIDWDILKLDQGSYYREFCMWSRQRVTRKSTSIVKNIKAIVVGHTPIKKPMVLGNHVYIDCGACFTGGQLIIKSYDQILEMVDDNIPSTN